ncbi:amidase [Cohnella pontilimi]|uniref:Amidase n=1 Tax=Cohnella pontilimi TaxID=2564100 RepID=A0A4U0F7Z1_9BACL|nr:amidase family protein [Cohnella pontilimi]TJY40823.1 amidase [Cohnella pontilimi]
MDSYFQSYDKLVEEATIPELQAAMDNGTLTSKELVLYYLYRIATYDQSGPMLNSVIELNPDAVFIAEALDEERKAKGARSPLHGIPVLLKDNIETGDKMRTTAGALALQNHVSSRDAFLVQKLRAAGAVILGKTNLTEWANGMSSEMWAGYSAHGGQTRNPYGEFFVGGSSSGSAVSVASNLTSVSVGTETSASILSPAIQNSIVGIKPTVGLISRAGVIPFSYSQDTAGPMGRTVTDAAILLGVLAGKDDNDPATWRMNGSVMDYRAFLDSEGLRSARIGVYRNFTLEMFNDEEEYDERLFQQAVDELKQAGAQVIDSIEIPSFHREWGWTKVRHEFAHGVENYLRALPPASPVHSLQELVEWNESSADKALKYGQDKLKHRAVLNHPLRNPESILEWVSDLYYARKEGLDYALEKYELDATLFPSYIGADISARAGYPSVAVPAGFKPSGRPFGITFAGKAFSEPALIRMAYAFEQRTKHRRKPIFK